MSSYSSRVALFGLPFLMGLSLLAACSSEQPTWFEDVTDESRIDYTGGSFGAAWGDANRDGYPDLWASGHSPQRLMMNLRDGTFEDVTKEIVTPIRSSDRHNAAWADFDNDGDDDLIQLSGGNRGFGVGDPNALYVNDNGRLTDRAAEYGVDYPLSRSRAAVWVDVDSDGRLDLVTTAAELPKAPPALFMQGEAGFTGRPLGFIDRSETAQLAMLTADRDLELITVMPTQAHAIRDGQFVPAKDDLWGKQAPDAADIVVADLDNDLFADLIFVNGRLGPGMMQVDENTIIARLQSYNNDYQRLEFRGPSTIVLEPYPLAAVWWGKGNLFIGKDGKPPEEIPLELNSADADVAGLAEGEKGLFVGFEDETDSWIVEIRDPGWNSVNLRITSPEVIDKVKPKGFSPDVSPFSQVVVWNERGKLGTPVDDLFGKRNCFAGAVGDFDNDMDQDVYLVCGGYLKNTKNVLFENLGDREFRRVKKAGGARGTRLGIGDSVAVADYDADGFLDLFVRNGRGLAPFGVGPDQLFRNAGNGNHWLEIDLEGDDSNRNGIGARVTLISGKHRQVRFADNGTHGYVQDFRRLHFGLGKKQSVDKITVEWPSGRVVTYEDIEADQVVVLKEDGGIQPRW